MTMFTLKFSGGQTACEMLKRKGKRRELKREKRVLVRWLSWLECQSIHQKGAGSIPGQVLLGGN